MIGCTHNIIRNAIKTDKPKNILIASYDGIFEWNLCNSTPHNYYQLENIQQFIQPKAPHSRLYKISPDMNTWSLSLDIDLIICNDIISQVNICNNISKILHIPLIIVHHSIKQPFVKKEDIYILLNEYKKATRIVTNSLINKSWYANFKCIPYGVELIEQTKHEQKILIIGNFDPSSIPIVKTIQQNSKIPVTILGNNPGISTEVSLNKCLKHISTHKIFINLFNDSDINPLMLYAMAAGCSVVSSPSPLNNDVIEHGINGYIAKSFDQFIKLSHQTMLPTIGRNAQNTIKQQFSITTFTEKWNKLIDTISNTPFRL